VRGFEGTLDKTGRRAGPDVGNIAAVSGIISLAASVPEVPGSPFSRRTS
jgi:hypothetical protein